MTPKTVFEASVVNMKGRLKSVKANMGVVQSLSFKLLKASC